MILTWELTEMVHTLFQSLWVQCAEVIIMLTEKLTWEEVTYKLLDLVTTDYRAISGTMKRKRGKQEHQ